jgi:hypothetical protein
MLWGSEKCQNKHSVAIAGIDLCHIYIFVIQTQQDATHRNKTMICTFHIIGDSMEGGKVDRAWSKYDYDEKFVNRFVGIMMKLRILGYLHRKTVKKVFRETYRTVMVYV